MSKNTIRHFRSKTIVLKKKYFKSFLFFLGLGIGFFMLLSHLPSFTPAALDLTPFYKVCLNTTIPASSNGDRTVYDDLYGSILSAVVGFDIRSIPTVIAGQVPAIHAVSAKIIQYPPTVAASAPKSDVATPTPSPTPAPETDSGKESHPIAEVSLVSGGIRNTAGPNKDIYVENFTDYDIDIPALLNEPLKISPVNGQPFVLVIHTHTTESYTPAGQTTYHTGDSTRTQDLTQNVVRVGDEITQQLSDAGIHVIHDKTINDYPSYNGSYKKTLSIIEGYLEKYPSIQIVLDIHRDGMTKQDGTKLKVCAEIDGEKTAQIQLVLGTDQGGLKNDNWRENLKLGLRVQDMLTRDYPRFARPLGLQKERYNMHATLGSMIIEVGTDGNTLEEAVAAGKYVGRALAKVISTIK